MRKQPLRACRDCGKAFVPSWPTTIRCDDCHASRSPRRCHGCGATVRGQGTDPQLCPLCRQLEIAPPKCKDVGAEPRATASRRKPPRDNQSAASKKARKAANNRLYRERHPEKMAEIKRRWRERNPDRARAYKRDYERNTRRENPRAKLLATMRSRVATALLEVKKRGRIPASRGAMRLVGCTVAELVVHLESQFSDGMCWGNFGRGGWHVDHIYPVAKADLTDEAHLLAAFNWRNCQPAWESDNLRKNANVSAVAKQHFETLVAMFRGP